MDRISENSEHQESEEVKEKAKIAKDLGCDYVINYKTEDIAKRVNEITHGAGVHVVYDAVGKDTFLASLDSLGLFGLMVSYGQASGDVPPFDIRRLTEKSLFITRPTLFLYKNHRKELKMSANEVFQMLINNLIILFIGGLIPTFSQNQSYPTKHYSIGHI